MRRAGLLEAINAGRTGLPELVAATGGKLFLENDAKSSDDCSRHACVRPARVRRRSQGRQESITFARRRHRYVVSKCNGMKRFLKHITPIACCTDDALARVGRDNT